MQKGETSLAAHLKQKTENTVETQTKGTSEAKIVHREGEEGKLYVDRSAVQCSAAAAEAAAVAAAKENQFCFLIKIC